MKRLAVLLAICMCLCFAGCEVHETAPEANSIHASNHDVFVEVVRDSDNNIIVYRDTVTDVMYACYSNIGYKWAAGGLSVMYAPDGTPLLYPEWLELYFATNPV